MNVGRKTEASFRAAARDIARAARRIDPVGDNGLRWIGEEIMTDVKASRPGAGVPRDTGALAATGAVDGPLPNHTVELGFGDSTVDYALVQHENLDYVHPLGEHRYLVRGVERWRPGGSSAMQALAENMDAAIRAAAK